jgi:hypothetical protein
VRHISRDTQYKGVGVGRISEGGGIAFLKWE